MSANKRTSIRVLKHKKELNLKKADKGTTTVILDTTQKLEEGTQQLSDDKFYKPLQSPIVSSTTQKVTKAVTKFTTQGT